MLGYFQNVYPSIPGYSILVIIFLQFKYLLHMFSSVNIIYQVTIVKNEEGGNSVCTVVLRGSTDSVLDDLERAVDDGVNTYKVIIWMGWSFKYRVLSIMEWWLPHLLHFCWKCTTLILFALHFYARQCAGIAGLSLELQLQKLSLLEN